MRWRCGLRALGLMQIAVRSSLQRWTHQGRGGERDVTTPREEKLFCEMLGGARLLEGARSHPPYPEICLEDLTRSGIDVQRPCTCNCPSQEAATERVGGGGQEGKATLLVHTRRGPPINIQDIHFDWKLTFVATLESTVALLKCWPTPPHL